jgi:hypothetical protein
LILLPLLVIVFPLAIYYIFRTFSLLAFLNNFLRSNFIAPSVRDIIFILGIFLARTPVIARTPLLLDSILVISLFRVLELLGISILEDR